MRKIMKIFVSSSIFILFTFLFIGCHGKKANENQITIAAASSLEKILEEELIPKYLEKHPDSKVETIFDSSGKLEQQIKEGLEVDLFFSAATEPMLQLEAEGLVKETSVTMLLENQMVIIVPKSSQIKKIEQVSDLLNFDCIAIGDPLSVPAGQYAKDAMVQAKIWDIASSKMIFGNNVTAVVSWVENESASVGLVYKTDTINLDTVRVIYEIPTEDLTKPIQYPIALLDSSENKNQAEDFLQFLDTKESEEQFKRYGFIVLE